jgi:hypothetical protein
MTGILATHIDFIVMIISGCKNDDVSTNNYFRVLSLPLYHHFFQDILEPYAQ